MSRGEEKKEELKHIGGEREKAKKQRRFERGDWRKESGQSIERRMEREETYCVTHVKK